MSDPLVAERRGGLEHRVVGLEIRVNVADNEVAHQVSNQSTI